MGLTLSNGYAPLFSSLTTGTLCGKWPDIGLWAIVLSLKDRNGIVDVTPDYLSRVTGLQLEAVVACMARFCEPDQFSRTSAEDGRRLVLIEPERRNWGWRVVNSGLYREKARLQNKDAARTDSGADADRKRREREGRYTPDSEMSPAVPRSPPDNGESPEVPLSEAEAYTHKTAPRKRGCRVPEPFPITADMRAWAAAKCPHVSNVDGATEEFVDYWRGVAGRAATKLDWEGTWRNRMRELEARAGRGNGKPKASSEWT